MRPDAVGGQDLLAGVAKARQSGILDAAQGQGEYLGSWIGLVERGHLVDITGLAAVAVDQPAPVGSDDGDRSLLPG